MPSIAVGDHVIPLYTPKFRFDAVAAIEDGRCTPKTLVDQDDADQFLERGLKPFAAAAVLRKVGLNLTLKMYPATNSRIISSSRQDQSHPLDILQFGRRSPVPRGRAFLQRQPLNWLLSLFSTKSAADLTRGLQKHGSDRTDGPVLDHRDNNGSWPSQELDRQYVELSTERRKFQH
jgi:hypothetical protein